MINYAIKQQLLLLLYYFYTPVVKIPAVKNKSDKIFELMLTRRAKAYSSSCSQTVSLSPAISSSPKMDWPFVAIQCTFSYLIS